MQLFCWPYFIIPANHISIDASTYQNIEVSKYRNIEIPKHQKIEVSTPQNIDTSIHRNIEISKHRNIQISKFQCFEISRYRSVDMPIASENEMPIQVHVIDNPLFIDHKNVALLCRTGATNEGTYFNSAWRVVDTTPSIPYHRSPIPYGSQTTDLKRLIQAFSNAEKRPQQYGDNTVRFMGALTESSP